MVSVWIRSLRTWSMADRSPIFYANCLSVQKNGSLRAAEVQPAAASLPSPSAVPPHWMLKSPTTILLRRNLRGIP